MGTNYLKMDECLVTSRFDNANKTMFIKDTNIFQSDLMGFVSAPQTRQTPINEFKLR